MDTSTLGPLTLDRFPKAHPSHRSKKQPEVDARTDVVKFTMRDPALSKPKRPPLLSDKALATLAVAFVKSRFWQQQGGVGKEQQSC